MPPGADATGLTLADFLTDGRWRRLDLSAVEGRRDVAVDCGVHPIGRVEQQPELRRHGHGITQQVLQRGCVGTVEMDALADLRQLVGVAEQDVEDTRSPSIAQEGLASDI